MVNTCHECTATATHQAEAITFADDAVATKLYFCEAHAATADAADRPYLLVDAPVLIGVEA